MHHVNESAKTHPRCPVCWNDVYKSGGKFDCTQCYGTTFDGGINTAYRAWAIFTDAQDVETQGKRGLWHPVASSIHTEHEPDLWQRDYVVRVTKWSPDHRVMGVDSIYVLKEVTNDTVRTGNARGQTSLDLVSQRCDLQMIAEGMPIHKYPFVGTKFDRWDGNVR